MRERSRLWFEASRRSRERERERVQIRVARVSDAWLSRTTPRSRLNSWEIQETWGILERLFICPKAASLDQLDRNAGTRPDGTSRASPRTRRGPCTRSATLSPRSRVPDRPPPASALRAASHVHPRRFYVDSFWEDVSRRLSVRGALSRVCHLARSRTPRATRSRATSEGSYIVAESSETCWGKLSRVSNRRDRRPSTRTGSSWRRRPRAPTARTSCACGT